MVEGNPDHPVSAGEDSARAVSRRFRGSTTRTGSPRPLRAGAGGFEAIGWDEALELLASRLGSGGRSLFLTGPKGPHRVHAPGRISWSAVGGRRVVHDALDDCGAPGRRQHRLRGERAAALRDRRCALPGVVRRRLPRDLAVAGEVRGRLRADARRSDNGEKGRFVVCGSAPVAHRDRTPTSGSRRGPVRKPPSRWRSRASWCGAAAMRARTTMSCPATASRTRRRRPGWRPRRCPRSPITSPQGDALALGPGLAGNHQAATAANLAVLILNAAAGSLGNVRMHIDAAADREASSYGDLARRDHADGRGELRRGRGVGHEPRLHPAPRRSGFRRRVRRQCPSRWPSPRRMDETAAMADLVLPDSHPLESWGDSRPGPGTYAVRQPAMRPVPLFDSRPMADVLLETGQRLGHDFGAATFRDYLRGCLRQVARARRGCEPGWRETRTGCGVPR